MNLGAQLGDQCPTWLQSKCVSDPSSLAREVVMARSFWTTLTFAFSLQLFAIAGLVAIAVHDQAVVVSTTLHHTALLSDGMARLR
jgi:hypothetical protein